MASRLGNDEKRKMDEQIRNDSQRIFVDEGAFAPFTWLDPNCITDDDFGAFESDYDAIINSSPNLIKTAQRPSSQWSFDGLSTTSDLAPSRPTVLSLETPTQTVMQPFPFLPPTPSPAPYASSSFKLVVNSPRGAVFPASSRVRAEPVRPAQDARVEANETPHHNATPVVTILRRRTATGMLSSDLALKSSRAASFASMSRARISSNESAASSSRKPRRSSEVSSIGAPTPITSRARRIDTQPPPLTALDRVPVTTTPSTGATDTQLLEPDETLGSTSAASTSRTRPHKPRRSGPRATPHSETRINRNPKHLKAEEKYADRQRAAIQDLEAALLETGDKDEMSKRELYGKAASKIRYLDKEVHHLEHQVQYLQEQLDLARAQS